MHDFIIEMLQCPACHGTLAWEIQAQHGAQIESAQVRCQNCAATYEVREGIGMFLVPDLQRVDLWEQAGTGIAQFLAQRPHIEEQLLASPLETLNPADAMFRAMVLEERGECEPAIAAFDYARPHIYTPEYLAGWQSQVDFVVERLATRSGPIVDLATGRGYLLEALLDRLPNVVIGTDVSPRVLRRNRQRLEFLGCASRASLLAFDARRTPFKDEAIRTLTSNLGLANIELPGDLLDELRRITSGEFLSISHFIAEDDAANRAVAREIGVETMLVESLTLENFRATGWQCVLANEQQGHAEPTPAGRLIPATLDRMPATSTVLKWGVVIGS